MSYNPQFIQSAELSAYNLPQPSDVSGIISLIQQASTLIDSYCMRQDTNGWGSLVWTTYSERLYLPEGRNIVRLSYRPLSAVPVNTFNSYGGSGTSGQNLLQPNIYTGSDGVTLSPLCAITGRYGYGRRAQQQVYPDLNYGANILQIASYFGGPPQFTPIDITNTDFDPLTGEIWVPAGLYLSAYTEIFVVYNSGFPPDMIPWAIKQATAMLVTNFLVRPASTLTSFGVGQIHHQFTEEMITPDIDRLLIPFKTFFAI